MKKDLLAYTSLISSFLSDPHQRVRHAALSALALFAETFADGGSAFKKMYALLFVCILATLSLTRLHRGVAQLRSCAARAGRGAGPGVWQLHPCAHTRCQRPRGPCVVWRLFLPDGGPVCPSAPVPCSAGGPDVRA